MGDVEGERSKREDKSENLLIVQKRIEKGGKGEVEIEIDDIVLLAQEEGVLRLMMEEFKAYLWERGLVLTVNKSKMMRFVKVGSRRNEGR